MPQFIKFPVVDQQDYDRFAAERLAMQPELRFDAQWRQDIVAGRVQWRGGKAEPTMGIERPVGDGSGGLVREEWPRLCWADRWGGFFGPLRNMMGLQGLCLAFYDQPRLIERMMADRADATIAITEEVLKHTSFDTFWFWEDMAYNAGPLIGPSKFRKLALPYYRKVCDWLHSRGIKHIGLDSDGDIRLLIPIWLDAGINMLWPFEVQSGMDVVAIRKQYGRDLVMMGGIDKRKVAAGWAEMCREVDRVMPLVEQGGYIPELDHSVPPDISWPAMCSYVSYLKYRLGRG